MAWPTTATSDTSHKRRSYPPAISRIPAFAAPANRYLFHRLRLAPARAHVRLTRGILPLAELSLLSLGNPPSLPAESVGSAFRASLVREVITCVVWHVDWEGGLGDMKCVSLPAE